MALAMDQVAIQILPWREPAEALGPFAEEPHALLFGGEGGDWTYLMRAPERIMETGAGALGCLAEALGSRRPGRADGPPFQAGWAGLATYELAAEVEPLALEPHPDWSALACGLYLSLLAFDRRGRRVLAVGRDTDARQAEGRASAAAGWLARPPRSTEAPDVLARAPEASSGEAYEAAVAEVVSRIAAGELFQANVARRWRGRLEAAPYDLYLRLQAQSPAPMAAYLRLPRRAVVSNSPERFVQVDAQGRMETRPIKGTRPRGRDTHSDAALAQALLADPKDRAENLMIVDLMRNDISRVCRPGTVRAPELFRLESYANVHHLVSVVTGLLAEGVGPAEVLKAAFPPGSITGAPKVQAMKVIAALEPARGPYCGSLFWAGLDGAMDSSVLIRTVQCVKDEGGWRFEAGAGAGIVAESVPRQERLETEAKIAAITRALGEPAGPPLADARARAS